MQGGDRHAANFPAFDPGSRELNLGLIGSHSGRYQLGQHGGSLSLVI